MRFFRDDDSKRKSIENLVKLLAPITLSVLLLNGCAAYEAFYWKVPRCDFGSEAACQSIVTDCQSDSSECKWDTRDLAGDCLVGNFTSACEVVGKLCQSGSRQACDAIQFSPQRVMLGAVVSGMANAASQPPTTTVRIPQAVQGPNQAAGAAQRQQWCAQAQETGNINSWEGMHVCGGWPPK